MAETHFSVACLTRTASVWLDSSEPEMPPSPLSPCAKSLQPQDQTSLGYRVSLPLSPQETSCLLSADFPPLSAFASPRSAVVALLHPANPASARALYARQVRLMVHFVVFRKLLAFSVLLVLLQTRSCPWTCAGREENLFSSTRCCSKTVSRRTT